jgi:hypothetical protein
MRNARGLGRLGLLAVGLGIGAALAATPGLASADPSTDPFSWIDQLLGGLSVPAQTSALDMQVSIDGTDLFPTAGNTATATSDMGDIAIAIGNGADAYAASGSGDFAFADGANSIAEAGILGDFDSALVFGANSTADAGFGVEPGVLDPFGVYHNFDLAAAFGDMLGANAINGDFMVDIQPPL